jgi:hypothetical protein
MDKIFTNVHEALASRIPETKAWIISTWTARFENAISKFGSTLPYKSNVSRADYALLQFARGLAKTTKPERWEGTKRLPAEYALDTQRLAKLAQEKAEALCLQWETKINGKIESLTNVKLVYGGDLTYMITGERDGEKVTIEQIMTLCANSHGTVYNQFPARIYMDGKFVPEAEYKKMFGEEKPMRPIAGYKHRAEGRYSNRFKLYPVAADGKKTDGEAFYMEGGKAMWAKLAELNAKYGK